MHSRVLWFILITLLINIPLEWYTYQGIKTLSCNTKSPLRKAIRRGYWIFMFTVGVCLVIAFQRMQANPLAVSNFFVKWTVSGFMTLIVTKIVFALVLFGEDIYRWLVAVFRFFNKKIRHDHAGNHPFLPERRKWLSQAGLIMAGIPFVSFMYGIIKGKYDYQVHRQTLYFEDLPENFDGFTIAQISDIHSGSFDDAEAVQKGIELVKAQKADLFVFTGDMVNNIAEEIVPWIDAFKQIKAPYGQFSVFGNHDYGDYMSWDSEAAKEANLQDLRQHHQTMGYRLMRNENVAIEKDGQKIMLLGVENWGNGFIQKGDLDEAMKGVDDNAFKILLSHDPSHWDEKVRYYPSKIHLTLSGHTHGMQFGIEVPGFKWSPVKYRYPHWAGLASHHGRHLYVNRGFGFIGFSGRVGIWPEITVLELKKA